MDVLQNGRITKNGVFPVITQLTINSSIKTASKQLI